MEARNPDTDGDGAVDGGGPIQGAHYTIAEETEEGGEFYGLPSDPTEADVVHVLVATDASFRDRSFDYEAYINERFAEINQDYRENTDGVTPHL